jgi:hypothetical protein
MWSAFWDWLAKLPQGSASFVGTLTGSSFGLLAILLGALFNSYLNRRRDDRQRDQERQALAATLYAELTAVHRYLTDNVDLLGKVDRESLVGWKIGAPSIKLLPEVMGKLGLFRPHTTLKVLDAYLRAERFVESLPRGRPPKWLEGDEIAAAFVAAEHIEIAVALSTAAAQAVKEAIDALGTYLTETA